MRKLGLSLLKVKMMRVMSIRKLLLVVGLKPMDFIGSVWLYFC
jgi:hypothetical protein